MNRKRGYLYILLAAMIYSTTEVALKGLGGVFAPMQITVERVLIGALFMLPFALRSLRRNAIRLPHSDWSYFALLGFLTVTLHMSLLQMAVLHMDASATSIIYSGNPVFALAAAHLILHEPLKRNHLIAIGVELIGILFILNPTKLEVSPRGFAEIFTATVLFAMYGTLCKLRIPRLGGLVITTFSLLLGSLELLALLLLGHIPAVGALYRSLGLDIFADVKKMDFEEGIRQGLIEYIGEETVDAFLDLYGDSITFMSDEHGVAGAAALVGELGIPANEQIAAKALPQCNQTFITGADMKATLEEYYQVLFQANPDSIGGSMPYDAFYYGAE